MRGTLLALLGAAACTPYNVHRAALGPHPEPVLYSAEPSEGIAEIGLGASSIAHTTHVKKGNAETAVESPGTQVRGDLRFQVSDRLALGLAYSNGLAATAQKPEESQPDVDNGNVEGYGFLADVSIPTNNPNLWVGLHVDMTIWSVPWVEYSSSTDPGIPWVIERHGSDSVGTFAFGVTPSYKAGRITWFGGLTAREHPTIQEKDIEVVVDLDADVKSGPFNFIVSAGLEAQLASQVKGSLVVYQDITQDPNIYGPAIGAMVIIPLGQRHKPPEPRPVYTPPTAPPPPPPPPMAPGARE
jgi:hypothetical protein